MRNLYFAERKRNAGKEADYKKMNTALKLLKEQGCGAVNIEQPAKGMGCFTQPV